MQLTKGAIGNLINRYKAVLKKCHLMNVFGSLAVAGMLVMGGTGMADAVEWDASGNYAPGINWSQETLENVDGNLLNKNNQPGTVASVTLGQGDYTGLLIQSFRPGVGGADSLTFTGLNSDKFFASKNGNAASLGVRGSNLILGDATFTGEKSIGRIVFMDDVKVPSTLSFVGKSQAESTINVQGDITSAPRQYQRENYHQ